MATYTVKSGDTLANIASDLGIADWRTLFVNGTLAGETDPRKLQIGAVITTTDPATIDPDEPIVETEPAPTSTVDSGVEGQDIDPATGEIRATGILGGGKTVRVEREGVPDIWAQVYTIPGTTDQVWYQFDPNDSDGDGVPDEVFATFGTATPPYELQSEGQWSQREQSGALQFAGEAPEVTTMQGDFSRLWFDTMDDALRAAGVNDPSMRGRMLRDPGGEMARLLTTAALPGSTITEDEITATLRNSALWQEIYPGIDYFFNQGVDNPEVAYRQYQSNVTPILRELGYEQDANGEFLGGVEALLNAGVDDAELSNFAPTIKRIQENPELKSQFDAWSLRERGVETTFDEFIDMLAGTTDPQLNNIIEKAELAYASERAGVQASVEEIQRLAELSNLTPDEALRAFTSQDKALLAIGDQDLSTFGFTKGDLLDVAAGVAPRSGISAASVENLANKLATERAISDDPTARFFLGFNERGAPQRSGLRPLAAEGG